MFIGLDGEKQHIRRHLASGAYATQKLTAFFTSNADTLPVARLQRVMVQDQFSKSSACDFLQLQQMPLKANGEIDRERIMSDDATGRASRARVAPRTELENQIARIWRNLLGTPSVGIHDSFFELGGHSLLAVRLIFEIRDALRVELPLEKIIEAPTIAGMAHWLEDHAQSGAEPAAPLPDCLLPLQPHGTKPPFFCVHPSLGSPLCYLNLAAHLGAERPCYGFQSPGLIDDKKPLTRVEEMAALYVDAMRTVQAKGPYLLGGWSSAGPIVFEMARLLQSQNERVEVLAFFDCGLMRSDIPNRKGGFLNPLLVVEGISIFLKFLWQIGWPRSYAQLRGLASFVGINLPMSIREFLGRDFGAQLRFLKRLHSDMMRSARVFRYNTKAGINYEPGPYAGKATLFRPEQSGVNGTDPMLEDLRKLAAGGVEKYIVPGNHISIILGQDESKILGEKLRECLDHFQIPKEGGKDEISSSVA
jgi:acyl carrier protein